MKLDTAFLATMIVIFGLGLPTIVIAQLAHIVGALGATAWTLAVTATIVYLLTHREK